MAADSPASLDNVANLRQRLDAFNRWLHRLESDLAELHRKAGEDSSLAEAIGAHLDAIGLDDLNPNRTAATNI